MNVKKTKSSKKIVLKITMSMTTALPVSLQLSLLHVAFAMPLRCSPLKFFVPGASQTSAELCSLCRSSSLSAGVPPCLPEFLLLPWTPFPLEFFGDSSQSFPCLPRAFLLSPMTLLLHHSFAVL